MTFEQWRGRVDAKYGKEKSVAISRKSGIIISSPIERNTSKGRPNAISILGAKLNKRQERLLEKLPAYDDFVIVRKKDVNLKDISALTAQTGVEFAMFTKKGERMIIRGNSNSVNITLEKAQEMAAQGWKWSGHTHPVTELNSIVPSKGDLNILKQFPQKHSVIYNSKGEFYIFEKR